MRHWILVVALFAPGCRAATTCPEAPTPPAAIEASAFPGDARAAVPSPGGGQPPEPEGARRARDDAAPPGSKVTPPGSDLKALLALVPTSFGLELEVTGEGSPSVSVTLRARGAQVEVTAVEAGLLDDSVAAVRHVGVASRDADGRWSLTPSPREQSCHPGRGHEDFRPEPCL
ncbi:MAG: hypothetical protein AAF928_07785 [Myxococcota bacterium]